MYFVLFWLSQKLETCSVTGLCRDSLLSFLSPPSHHSLPLPFTAAGSHLDLASECQTSPFCARARCGRILILWRLYLCLRPDQWKVSQFCFQFLPPCSVGSFWVAIHYVLKFRDNSFWNGMREGKMHLLLWSMYHSMAGSSYWSTLYLRFWTIKHTSLVLCVREIK